MTVIHQKCPNCGAPVKRQNQAHFECSYCHSTLYFSDDKQTVKLDSSNPPEKPERKKAVSKKSSGPPLPFVFFWVVVCFYMASTVGGSGAIIPIAFGLFGAYMMLSKRRKKH